MKQKENIVEMYAYCVKENDDGKHEVVEHEVHFVDDGGDTYVLSGENYDEEVEYLLWCNEIGKDEIEKDIKTEVGIFWVARQKNYKKHARELIKAYELAFVKSQCALEHYGKALNDITGKDYYSEESNEESDESGEAFGKDKYSMSVMNITKLWKKRRARLEDIYKEEFGI